MINIYVSSSESKLPNDSSFPALNKKTSPKSQERFHDEHSHLCCKINFLTQRMDHIPSSTVTPTLP